MAVSISRKWRILEGDVYVAKWGYDPTFEGDASAQLSNFSLAIATPSDIGTFGNDRLLYWELVDVAGTRTVNIYADSAKTILVATGSLAGDGTITLASSGGSGITGSVDVVYSGDDIDSANIFYFGDGSMYAPFLTLDVASSNILVNEKLVIGEGYWDSPRTTYVQLYIEADGLCISTQGGLQTTDDERSFVGFIVVNWISFFGINYSDATISKNNIFYNSNINRASGGSHENNWYININLAGIIWRPDLNKCVLVNVNGSLNPTPYKLTAKTFKKTIIKDCPGFYIQNNGNPTEWDNNCIYGVVMFDDDNDGIYQARDLSDIKGYMPSFNVNSIDDDPLFVNEGDNNYLLQNSSPCKESGKPTNGFNENIGSLIGAFYKNGEILFDNATSTTNATKNGTSIASLDSVNEWAIESEIISIGKTVELGRLIPYLDSVFQGHINVYIKHGLTPGSLSTWQRVKFFSEKPMSDGTYGNDDVNCTDANLKSIVCSYIQFKFEATVDFELAGIICEITQMKYFEEAFTKTAIEQKGSSQGNFTGAGYECLLLPQFDSEIDAITTGAYKIENGVVYTYDEIVAIAASSPASGNPGHVEITYSNATPSEHNIEKIEVNITATRVKTLYTFNQS